MLSVKLRGLDASTEVSVGTQRPGVIKFLIKWQEIFLPAR